MLMRGIAKTLLIMVLPATVKPADSGVTRKSFW
jgi:hypothetical protein